MLDQGWPGCTHAAPAGADNSTAVLGLSTAMPGYAAEHLTAPACTPHLREGVAGCARGLACAVTLHLLKHGGGQGQQLRAPDLRSMLTVQPPIALQPRSLTASSALQQIRSPNYISSSTSMRNYTPRQHPAARTFFTLSASVMRLIWVRYVSTSCSSTLMAGASGGRGMRTIHSL